MIVCCCCSYYFIYKRCDDYERMLTASTTTASTCIQQIAATKYRCVYVMKYCQIRGLLRNFYSHYQKILGPVKILIRSSHVLPSVCGKQYRSWKGWPRKTKFDSYIANSTDQFGIIAVWYLRVDNHVKGFVPILPLSHQTVWLPGYLIIRSYRGPWRHLLEAISMPHLGPLWCSMF